MFMVMVVLMPLHIIKVIQSLLQLCKVLLCILQISRLQISIEALQDLVELTGTLGTL